MRANKLKTYWRILVESLNLFIDFNGLKLAAALSYYAVFSIAPLLIVIISVAGVFFGQEAVTGSVYHQISGLVGSDAALQVQDIISNIHKSNHGKAGGVIGAIILIIGASGVFSEIQGSINYLWSVPPPKKKEFLMAVIRKLVSFSLLIGVSFLLMVSLLANALVDALSDRMKHFFNSSLISLLYVVNIFIILILVSFLFTLIFKILPNAIIRWKDAVAGATLTALLFLIGKFAIGFYLGSSSIGFTYGTTASIVILMLWVYYSSIILYFGATYTYIFAASRGNPVRPR
ncbi:MAG: YihY/virulence factor BrkB family protein [Bacteroidota bacterium]|nr:YihY/virulence factor BrkB family protein [Bacteroidota bacterium]MDP4212042.1 YihY/virulence factor BrkB family protein [Bacteroidota bacterium]MDP4249609.1 YihY/virulence factor BrkB family protein [Bacteroidota bacterium]